MFARQERTKFDTAGQQPAKSSTLKHPPKPSWFLQATRRPVHCLRRRARYRDLRLPWCLPYKWSVGERSDTMPPLRGTHAVQADPGRAQCVAAEVHPPKTKLPKNVPPRTDMKYPTFMVMTANMLHKTSDWYDLADMMQD